MNTRSRLAGLSVAGLIASGFARGVSAEPPKPTIVHVHGAFAGGSGLPRVIPILENDGDNVIAVRNPPTSVEADVEATKRVIDAQLGQVVDRPIDPGLEHFYGERIEARTTEIKSSHVPFVSRPDDVASVIEHAAVTVRAQ